MSTITDMLVSALVGGAGVKLLELVVAWRKDSTASILAEETAKQQRVRTYAEIESKLREELRADNESLREKVRQLESTNNSRADTTGKMRAASTALEDDITDTKAKIAVLMVQIDEIKQINDELRSTNRTLVESQNLMAQTIVALKAELEAYEAKDTPPAPGPVAPRARKTK